MARCHQAALEAEGIMQHLGNRREAVRCAGGVRDDLVLRRQRLVVDADDDNGIDLVLGRGRHDDLLRPSRQVLLASLAGPENAGALKHHVGLAVGPRQVRRVLLRGDGDARPIDDQHLALGLDVALEPTVHAVILQQVCQRFGIGQVVDADDVELVLSRPHRPEHDAADAAKSVDADVACHPNSLLIWEHVRVLKRILPRATTGRHGSCGDQSFASYIAGFRPCQGISGPDPRSRTPYRNATLTRLEKSAIVGVWQCWPPARKSLT